MKYIIKTSWVYCLAGVALCTLLLSFSTNPGAHSFQVYLDSKLVLDQYADTRTDAPKILLSSAEKYNQLIVKYNECGRTVTGRVITLKDEHNKVLKDWRFEGTTSGYKDPMTCNMKDIAALKQKGSNTLKLFYSSKEFPEGMQIANLVFDGKAATVANN